MSKLARIRLMLRMVLENPIEFCERTAAVADRCRDRWRDKGAAYNTVDFGRALRLADDRLKSSMAKMDDEPGLAEIERKVDEQANKLRGTSPFPAYENADATLARFCYLAVRALRPRVFLETGVASGITSAFILQALSLNGEGELWSIDLPPLAAEANTHVGAAIPEELKARWHLQIGPSRRVLPQLLHELGQVDIFVHDSLHTYKNMQAEFRAVWPLLRPGGLLIADDVESNRAFGDFAKAKNCSSWFVVQQDGKRACFGVAIKEGWARSK